MPGQPAVTVLLSVYNDLAFVPQAVQSVLGQRFTHFDFLIIDDGSTDGTAQYLASLTDSRIRVIHNDRNIGLTRSLNRGLDLSVGKYIARMDADDVCLVDRMAKQVEFLDAHPDIGILGTSRQLIDVSGNDIAVATAITGDLAIRKKCLLGNPFAHPSVMLRRSTLEAHRLRYDESFRTAQDYELWTRVLQHTRGENLNEPLLKYRMRDGISRLSKTEQLANHDRIAQLAIERLIPGFSLSLEEVRQLRGRFGGFSVRDESMDPSDLRWTKLHERLLTAMETACLTNSK